ncbi:MAG TPA: PIN domain-containing protein [Polyangia bacterium]|jgi:predicted nucleic acid-binding protein
MSGEFLDTNVLIYAHDSTAGAKREVAVDLITRLAEGRKGLLSVQVLMEFYVNVTRKIPKPLAATRASEIIADFAAWPVFSPRVPDLLEAIHIAGRHRIGFWDALIVRAALGLGADVIWSEDLADGQRYQGVTVRNPFTAPSA